MAKLIVALCFLMFGGAVSAANQPPKRLSVLDHDQQVNNSASLHSSTTMYTHECGSKRPVRLSVRAAALFQKVHFPLVLKQEPTEDDNGNSDWDSIYSDGKGGNKKYPKGGGKKYSDELEPSGDGEADGESDDDDDWDMGSDEMEGAPPSDWDSDEMDGPPPSEMDGDGQGDGKAAPSPPMKAAPQKVPVFDTVLKDGFLRTDCIKDYMYHHGDKYGKGRHSYKLGKISGASIVRYDTTVAKEDQEQMTPEVCFKFCRTVPNMGFFGILNGRSCYCTPYYQKMAGDSSQCDAVCPGDPTNFCGGQSKSQIYSMHMCASALTDLEASADQASSAVFDLTEKVRAAKMLSTNMQIGAENLQKRLGALGDTEAASLMQNAKVAAGEIEHQAEDVETVVNKLAEITHKAGGIHGSPEAVREAESVTDAIDKTLAQSRTAADKLEKLVDVTTNSADRFGKEKGTAKQYYPLMYFVNKDFTTAPSTCSGHAVGAPMVDVTLDGCAWACDEHVDSCVGFSYYAKGKLCFLMSKFTTAFYYTGCKTLDNHPDIRLHQKQAFLSAPLQQEKEADMTCMAKFSEFEGTTLKPDPSGKCKQCLKTITKADRCDEDPIIM